MAAATRLRRLLEDPESFVLCPGKYDGFSARVALEVGFDSLYMTGAGSSASVLGHEDLGLLTQTQMRTNAEAIADLGALPENANGPIPVIADADTGYGGPIMVARTVQQYAKSGVAGLHMKTKCRRSDADISQERRFWTKMSSTSAFVLRYLRGNAINRLEGTYAAGADVTFFEGLTSKEQASKIIRDVSPMPVLLNMVESGATPSYSAAEAREAGFKIIIVPFVTIVPPYLAMKAELQHLKSRGAMTAESKKMAPQDLFRICGVDAAFRSSSGV
ncbi:Pyruvate/Phosphoenolpyruvate kinase-like domain-containing protein [Ilyonectria sp. MPI-CAGE-AT-0026]|nr:Pyruvate/Phosphoenolpyruvate kinase-like domain-containing protein [Ilyonectria sp. MPI-CAGE-AT-0026]